ncbi:bifunctional DNA primase/polymerase [Bradyrhizobium ottawaense]
MLNSTSTHNLDVALNLARAGAFVFPCQSSGPNKKQPCKGVYWRSASTRDEVQIRHLWSRHPDAVPGIDLAKSGLVVIDCDRKLNNGLEWFQAKAAQHHDALDNVPQTDTPSGGRHHFYQNTFDPPHGNGRGQLPPKREADVDVRGHGGFVIGPGALFSDGSGLYQGHGSIFDAPPVPDWLVDILKPAPSKPIAFTVTSEPVSDVRLSAYGETALQELLADLASAPPGARNDEANRISFRVGQLVGGGCLDRSSALSALQSAALSWGIRPTDKSLGPRGTIARALQAGEKEPRGPDDSPAPTVEILLAPDEQFDPHTGEITTDPLPKPAQGELPEHLTHIPGLVGDITDWICDTALHPQRGLALGAALTIVGTAAGRHISGPHRCGTHLYVVGLAPSGAGKNHPLSQIATVLAAADMQPHIGPSQFISMPAVINFLVRAPLSVCAMDEFGAFLKRINNRRASGFEGAISGLLRTAWGASFSAMSTPEWAQRSSETIFSPAMSIFGVSTAREFYDSLEGGDVTNGVLNRFLVIETKVRPKERAPLLEATEVPQEIIHGLKRIYNRDALASAQLCQSRQTPPFITVPISADAEQIRRGLVDEITARGDADSTLEPFLARTAENALRLATIVAVGRDVDSPLIDAPTMAWAREFAVWSSDRLADGAGLYIADSDTQAAANAVRRAIQESGGRVKRRELLRKLQHKYKQREVEDIIRMLAEAEHIRVEKVVPSGGGTPSFWYSTSPA